MNFNLITLIYSRLLLKLCLPALTAMFCLVEVQQPVLVQITTSWMKKRSPKSTLTHGRASTLVWKNDENFMSTILPICLTGPVPVTCLLNATFSKEAKQSISLEIFEKDNIKGDGVICIGNYTVREVLMKNRTRVWRNVYNTASA